MVGETLLEWSVLDTIDQLHAVKRTGSRSRARGIRRVDGKRPGASVRQVLPVLRGGGAGIRPTPDNVSLTRSDPDRITRVCVVLTVLEAPGDIDGDREVMGALVVVLALTDLERVRVRCSRANF